MSRLVENDVKDIKDDICMYDTCFKKQTGYTMEEIAKKAANVTQIAKDYKVAVVSVTSGLGVISGFANAVFGILKHYSIDAFVTETNDVDGIYEAIQKQADIIFMADDIRFIAFSVSTRGLADNGECTGAGFAEALICAMENKKEKVLVLGASNVGGAAVRYLLENGFPVDVYDTDSKMLEKLENSFEGLTKLKKAPILKNYKCIYDATTAADIITAEDVSADTIISAPGMPCGITEEACHTAVVIHNPLELGVITMYYTCIKNMEL